MDGVEVPYLVEESSRVSVNGRAIPTSPNRLKELYYGKVYGKSSG